MPFLGGLAAREIIKELWEGDFCFPNESSVAETADQVVVPTENTPRCRQIKNWRAFLSPKSLSPSRASTRPGGRIERDQARTPFTTRAGSTPVKRMSSPWNFIENRS